MEDLKNLLNFNEALPYLFIGSGFSRRYLNTPDWIGLLKYFCSLIHPENEFYFNTLQEQARQNLRKSGTSPDNVTAMNCAIADLLEDDFNLNWYSDPQFADSREKNKDVVSKENTPFKLELANFFNNALNQTHLLSEELEKLKNISSHSIAGIITTNYDCLLEEFFKYKKYTDQENLLFSSTQELCEIYKIHGCASDSKTIIINSDDYLRIAQKRKYLAAKLLTIFVEHPIVFIGYSVSDEDITNILSDIIDCLNAEQLALFKTRLLFVDMLSETESANYKIEDMNIVIHSKSIPMKRILLKDYGILYEFLSQNRSKYPVRILRELKQNIYDLVASNDPSDKLKIMLPIEHMDNFDNVEFVIGVGISHAAELAYSSFSAEDIFLDIVFADQEFNPDLLIEKTLPPHLSRTSGSMPMFKYLSQYSKPSLPSILEHYVNKVNNLDDLFSNSIKKSRSTNYGASVNDLHHSYSFPKSMYYITRLPIKNINPAELGQYLTDVLTNDKSAINTGTAHPHSSDIRRLIKVYDWLLYYDKFKIKQASMQSVPSE